MLVTLHNLEVEKERNDLKRDEVANNIEWLNKEIFEAELDTVIFTEKTEMQFV